MYCYHSIFMDSASQHRNVQINRPAVSTETIIAGRPRGIIVKTDEAQRTLTLLFKPGTDEQIYGNWAIGFNRTHPGNWLKVIVDITVCRLLNSTFYSGLVILHQDFPQAVIHLKGASQRTKQTLKILCLDNFIQCDSDSH